MYAIIPFLTWYSFYPFLWVWGLPLDPAYDLYNALRGRFGESVLLETVFVIVFSVIGGGLKLGCDVRDATFEMLGGTVPKTEE